MSEAKDKILEKYKPLTADEIKEEVKKQQELKKQYRESEAEVEKELLNFLQEDRPILNPLTDKPMLWIRQPTYKELEDWRNRFKKVRDMTQEEAEKYLETEEGKMGQFQIIADIVTKPKRTAEWWKENLNPTTEQLIEAEIVAMLVKAYGDVGFF